MTKGEIFVTQTKSMIIMMKILETGVEEYSCLLEAKKHDHKG